VAPGRLSHFSELTAVLGLPDGSKVTGGLSARGLANVAIQDWSKEFTFVVGDHHYQCRSSVAQVLSPRVSNLHRIDATISELRLDVEDGGKFFGSVLEAVGGGIITVDSVQRPAFAAICAVLWNSEFSRDVFAEPGDGVTMENVVDRLEFLPATQRDISTELVFISSHFYDFLYCGDALNVCLFHSLTTSFAMDLWDLRMRTVSTTPSVKAPKPTGKCLLSWNW
jgi:hypothetical protein